MNYKHQCKYGKLNINHTPDAICNCRAIKLETLVQSHLAKTTHPNALNHTLTTIDFKPHGCLKLVEVKQGS